jgi:peptidoglycan/LPS O-acetylase OafA/YrhL
MDVAEVGDYPARAPILRRASAAAASVAAMTPISRPCIERSDPAMNPALPTSRYALLDGARGLAAIAVMIYHYTQGNGLHWLGGAWVAVDLFFVLSGFVIAHGYGAKILAGQGFFRFFALRLIRLGPLYLVGLMLGVAAAVLTIRTGSATLTDADVIRAVLYAIFFVPNLDHAAWVTGNVVLNDAAFPLNGPSWSLSFELFANAVFWLWLYCTKRLSSVALVAFLMLIFLVTTVPPHMSNPGWSTPTFPYGFARVTAEFFLGALLYQVDWKNLPQNRFVLFLPPCMVFFLFLFSSNKIDLPSAVVVVPLAVLCMSRIELGKVAEGLAEKLGAISYPLYVCHFPLLRAAFEFDGFRRMDPVIQILFLSTLAIVGAALLVKLDIRVRRWLLTTTALTADRRVVTSPEVSRGRS